MNRTILLDLISMRTKLATDDSRSRMYGRNSLATFIKRRASPEASNGLCCHVFFSASCYADLACLLGVNSLMSAPGIDWSPAVLLPNARAVELFKAMARRDGIEHLLHIAEEAELGGLIGQLPSGSLVCYLPVSVFPTVELVARLFALQSGPVETSVFLDGNGTIVAIVRADSPPIDLASLKTDASRPLSIRLHDVLTDVGQHDAKLRDGIAALVRTASTDPSPPQALSPTLVRPGSSPFVEVESRSRKGEIRAELNTSNGRHIFVRQRLEFLQDDARRIFSLPLEVIGPRETSIAMHVRSEVESEVLSLTAHVPPHRLTPSMVSCYLNRGGGGNAVVHAFADAIGCRLAYAEDEVDTSKDVPIVWGVLRGSDVIVRRARAHGRYFFYIDHAYFNRGHGVSYRIARNSYEAGAVRKCPDDRLAQLHIETKPWRKSGRDIIICPPTEYFMQAHSCETWLEDTVQFLRGVTDRPLIIRTKPKAGETAVPIAQALETAHALVTHSSNVAMESIVLGTPVFVSPASAAAPVGRTDLGDIENPVFPDRGPWLAHLAYNQFSFGEIKSGQAWKMLLELEGREFA